MYKTVRHGENSLQYTILPQNDDFRIEGKLSSAESKCSRRSKKLKIPKRRSFFAYLGLIFVCTVIVGAVLIPFLVSVECLPSPTEWFLKTKAAFSKTLLKDGNKPYIKSNTKSSELIKHEQLIDNAANIGKAVQIIKKNGVEEIVLQYNKTKVAGTSKSHPDKDTVSYAQLTNFNGNSTSSFNSIGKINNYAQQIPNYVQADIVPSTDSHNLTAEIRFNKFKNKIDNGQKKLDDVLPTIVATTSRSQPFKINDINSKSTSHSDKTIITNYKMNNTTSMESIPITNTFTTSPAVTIRITSNVISPPNVPVNTIANQNTTASITTRIIQVPLLKSASKKPIMPPLLTNTSSKHEQHLYNNKDNTDNIINSSITAHAQQNKSTWIKAHWPYIDGSSYFQWTGYKTKKNVLLPALLGFALIGIILTITVCLIARNKRTIVSSVRKRNRNDIEETGTDDNATLLTATNLSDED